jgi:PAS domain-containing protein
MIADTDVVRRWTRTIEALRARSLKVRRHDPIAAAALDAILEESLEACGGLLQDLAGAQLLCEQLRHEARAEMTNRQYLLEQLPVACVSTDETGVIQNANQQAAEIFNISAKHLRGRLLLHFSVDRPAFGRLLQELPVGGSQLEALVPIRPRERGLSKLNALIVPETLAETSSWLWFLRPAAANGSGTSSLSEYSEKDIA